VLIKFPINSATCLYLYCGQQTHSIELSQRKARLSFNLPSTVVCVIQPDGRQGYLGRGHLASESVAFTKENFLDSNQPSKLKAWAHNLLQTSAFPSSQFCLFTNLLPVLSSIDTVMVLIERLQGLVYLAMSIETGRLGQELAKDAIIQISDKCAMLQKNGSKSMFDQSFSISSS
jgi:hypothetical protein